MILIRKPFMHLGAFMLTMALLFGLAACDLAGPTPSVAPAVLAPATPSATLETPATITPMPDQQQGTVILWHSWDEADRPVLEAILDAFQAAYPDVFLDVTYIPRENLKTRFELDAREGGGPTVLFGPAEWGPALYAAGLTPDLRAVVDQSIWDSLPQPALENVQFDGALVGLPYQMQGVVLVRNREIIPLAPETFDEMVTRAQDATQGDIIGAYLDRSFFYAGGHLLGLGGSLISPEGAPAFSSEQGLAWVGLLQAFENLGPVDFLSDEDLALFLEGRVGWIFAGSWRLPEIAAALEEEQIAVDPWPLYRDGRLAGFVQTENLYLTARAASAETLGARAGGDAQAVSLAFAEFLLSPQAQALLAQAGKIPVNREVEAPNRLVEQAFAALVGGTAYPVHPEFAFFPTALDAALQAVFRGELGPQEALAQAESLIVENAAASSLEVTPAPTAQ